MGNRLTGGKRPAEEAPCEQPGAQRVHTDQDDAELSDEEYDPAEGLSPAEAKRLEELAGAFKPLCEMAQDQEAADARHNSIEDELDRLDDLDLPELRRELRARRHKVARGASEEELRQQLADALDDEQQALRCGYQESLLCELQLGWEADGVCPKPKHVFRRPLGLLRQGRALIAVPQQSVLRGAGWLGRAGTRRDLEMLERLGGLVTGSARHPSWHIRFGSEGDAFPVPILAPPARELDGLSGQQRRRVLLQSVGLGEVLTECYMTSTQPRLECYDSCVEEALPSDWAIRLCDEREEAIEMLREQWEEEMDQALSPLKAKGPLSCYVTQRDTASCNPYLMLGVTEHGNVAGLIASLTWT